MTPLTAEQSFNEWWTEHRAGLSDAFRFTAWNAWLEAWNRRTLPVVGEVGMEAWVASAPAQPRAMPEDWPHCEELHNIAMDYRAALPDQAQHHYERLLRFIQRTHTSAWMYDYALRCVTERAESAEQQATKWAEIAATNGEMLSDAEQRLAQVEGEVQRLRAKCGLQRRELRRLNKCLGPYWVGFRKGIAVEEVCKLRAIMNKTFGSKAVLEAEHAAVDAARRKEG